MVMSENEPAQIPKRKHISPGLASLVTVLAVLVSPIAAMIYLGWGIQISIAGSFWAVYLDPYWGVRFDFSLLMFLVVSSMTFPRYVVPFFTYRFYRGRTTKRRLLISTVVAELWLPGFFYFQMLPSIIIGGFFYGLFLPTPMLALATVFLIRKYPRTDEHLIWTEAPEHQPWWIGEEKWWNNEGSKEEEKGEQPFLE
jgi:hypothetical protein